jgi:cellobiose epimerase
MLHRPEGMDMTDLRLRIENELRGNILPFWMDHVVDYQNGGFYGRVDNDLTVRNEIERSAVLNARILWTFAAAYKAYGQPEYESMARAAYDALRRSFRDPEYGGVYWSVNAEGRPVNDRKHVYAQAFTIYGLAEYVRATGNRDALEWAHELLAMVESYTHDDGYGGNVECRARDWSSLDDMRLSDKEPPAVKTMNTLLHLMEAYTNLRRVSENPLLQERHAALIQLFAERVLDAEEHRFHLFFDTDWRPLPDHISPGHDIEGSWLLVEAAEVSGRPDLLAVTKEMAVRMAEAVLQTGLDDEGFVIYEAGTHRDPARHWWPQAEGVVGFYNAGQLTGQQRFEHASLRLWELIEQFFVDRHYGEWFKIVRPDGTPDLSQPKTGPWECPYHNSRACLEMLARLPR